VMTDTGCKIPDELYQKQNIWKPELCHSKKGQEDGKGEW
jgi:hypothetical protein